MIYEDAGISRGVGPSSFGRGAEDQRLSNFFLKAGQQPGQQAPGSLPPPSLPPIFQQFPSREPPPAPQASLARTSPSLSLALLMPRTARHQKHDGLRGICWKASRIGERASPYVSAMCVMMAVHLLLIK